MQRSILAVSPNLQFLEQIRSHLEEGGRYRVQGVTSGADALALVGSTYYDLAILDAESSDVPFVPFTRDLVATQPGLKLLVFPPQNNPHHPVLAGLVSNGFLNKPFFTPEVSRALKNIFQEPVEEPEVEPELTNDLAKLWMQRPEMGIKRVEQLLGSTTAQTGLLVSQGKVIAGSGPCDDTTIQMALNLLDIHQIGKEATELMRFIPLESEGGELLIYASQLINNVTLVLFYPPTSSIQLVRQEVYQVKEEFKQAYPTTGELRRDLEVEPNILNEDNLTQKNESAQSAPVGAVMTEPGEEVLIPLEDEINSDELDSILGLIELKNLDAMLADMPAPDPDPDSEQPVVEESITEEAVISTDGVENSSWIPLAEAQEEAAQEIPSAAELAEVTIDSPYTLEVIEEMGIETPPPLPVEFLDQHPAEFSPEAIIADKIEFAQNDAEPADTAVAEEENVGIIEDSPVVSQAFPDFDFNLPWESAEQQADNPVSPPASIKSEYESPATAPDDQLQVPEVTNDSKDLDFSAWLDEIIPPAAPAENDAVESLVESDEVIPPLPVDEQVIESHTEPVAADDDISNLFSEFEPLPESIEFEAEIQESDEEEGSVPLVIPTEYEPADQELTQALTASFTPGDTGIEDQTTEEPAEESMQAPPLPVDSYNTNLSSMPGTSPLGVRNFRFNYSCLLIPRDPQQFLIRDLSERLSFLIPQLHLEYGWRLTGITIRPQYMLWSVTLPIDVCPVRLVRDIRRRTTAHITSNFTDLTPVGNGDDFWAQGFLILSGSTSPTVRMIHDFISLTRTNQSLND